MQTLYINGLNMGKTSARRYNRVVIAGESYNDWYFAMAAGYEIKVPGMHIKRFWQTVINGENALEIITYLEDEKE